MTAVATSPSSMNITVIPPNTTKGITFFELFAFSNGTDSANCTAHINSSTIGCSLDGLASETNYTIFAYSCINDTAGQVRSEATLVNFDLSCKF